VSPITCIVADDHPAMVEAVCDVLDESGVTVRRASPTSR
jgi:hypothetical protein